MHWKYNAFPNAEVTSLSQFGYFKTRQINKVSNILSKENYSLFDIQFSEGEMIAKQVIKATMLYIHIEKNIPKFTLDKEGIFEYIYHFAGYKDIDIEGHLDFSKRFYLSGKNEKEIKKFFTDELILFFESNPYYHIEAVKNGLLIIGNERLASVREIKGLAFFGMKLQEIIS